MKKAKIFPFSRQRFLAGKRIVTQAEIENRDCPACKGTGKKTLAQVGNTFTKKSELDWRCQICDGSTQIACTESTYRDLQDHYGRDPFAALSS